MRSLIENPATRGAAGSSVSVLLAGREPTDLTPENYRDQWDEARRLERTSIVQARSALLLRGADRIHALALASAYAIAARTAAHSAGEF